MNLSEHFTLEEATFSSTAVRNGIANQPGEVQLMNMVEAAAHLEKVRDLLGKPIHIDSWLRVPQLNASVGGAGHSAHQDGWAIDFICPGFGGPKEIAQAVEASNIAFDQLIYEGTWCHISFAPAMRRQVLTAHFTPGKATTYSQGV